MQRLPDHLDDFAAASGGARFQLEPMESRVMLSADPQGLIIKAVVAVMPLRQSMPGVFMSFRSSSAMATESFSTQAHVEPVGETFHAFGHHESATEEGIERYGSSGPMSQPAGENAGFVHANFIQVIAPIAPGLWEVVMLPMMPPGMSAGYVTNPPGSGADVGGGTSDAPAPQQPMPEQPPAPQHSAGQGDRISTGSSSRSLLSSPITTMVKTASRSANGAHVAQGLWNSDNEAATGGTSEMMKAAAATVSGVAVAGTALGKSATLYLLPAASDEIYALSTPASEAAIATAAMLFQGLPRAAHALIEGAASVESLTASAAPSASMPRVFHFAALGSPFRLIADSVANFAEESALIPTATTAATSIAGSNHRVARTVTLAVIGADLILLGYFHHRSRKQDKSRRLAAVPA